MNGRLCRAFRETDYVADGAVARIGRRRSDIAGLLRQLGVRQGAFLSAWNPMAQSKPSGWNLRAQARLQQAARRRRYVQAQSQPRRAAHARWTEDQLFIAADLRVVLVLARQFRQRAVVSVGTDGLSRLVWVECCKNKYIVN
jgi:hypothetical protein